MEWKNSQCTSNHFFISFMFVFKALLSHCYLDHFYYISNSMSIMKKNEDEGEIENISLFYFKLGSFDLDQMIGYVWICECEVFLTLTKSKLVQLLWYTWLFIGQEYCKLQAC